MELLNYSFPQELLIAIKVRDTSFKRFKITANINDLVEYKASKSFADRKLRNENYMQVIDLNKDNVKYLEMHDMS